MRPTRPRLTLVVLMAAIGACALGLAIVARAAPGHFAPALMVVPPLVGILWDRRGGGRGIRGGAVGGFLHAAICLPFFILGPVRAGLPGSWPAAYAGATVVCVAFGAMMGVATWLAAAVMGRTALARPSEAG
ncbi:hypothetical protein TA3x_003988 [Tundrisphaera sp. TA3]|uniref:hypothetical protein n=1 Tax=Tundrisphaera sp. TA3 TaxID=3435775 RepID=UPI003EBC513A